MGRGANQKKQIEGDYVCGDDIERLRAELYKLMELDVDYEDIVRKSQELDRPIVEAQKKMMKERLKANERNKKSGVY